MAIDLKAWNKTITRIARELHNGNLKPTDLDKDLLTKTFNELDKGARAGYGSNYDAFAKANNQTVQRIRQNIYQFSGAKTYQQLKKFNSLLVDENGKERSFSSFKSEVLKEHQKYNVNYLQAEFQTAKASAQMARKWEGFQRNKERYPNLKYKTVNDSHVRDEHQRLNNFIASIDDPIWNRIYPPNGWRCRCYVVQTDEAVDTTAPDTSFLKQEFAVHVGKTGVIYAPEHPYYVIPNGDDKAFAKAFESFKLIAGYGKSKYTSPSGKKVFVSPFADPEDLPENFAVAKVITNKLNREVRIRPHTNGEILLGSKNPEYLIGKKVAERKSPKGLNLRNLLGKAVKQGSSIVVVDLEDSILEFKTMLDKVKNQMSNKKTFQSIKEIIVISKKRDKIESVKRPK